jgi:hypothetical protein
VRPNDPGVQLRTHQDEFRSVDDGRCVRQLQRRVSQRSCAGLPATSADDNSAPPDLRSGPPNKCHALSLRENVMDRSINVVTPKPNTAPDAVPNVVDPPPNRQRNKDSTTPPIVVPADKPRNARPNDTRRKSSHPATGVSAAPRTAPAFAGNHSASGSASAEIHRLAGRKTRTPELQPHPEEQRRD